MRQDIESAGQVGGGPSRSGLPWTAVLCVIGLDYFSTLAYQPSIAFETAGRAAPFATVVVVLATLLCALLVHGGSSGENSGPAPSGPRETMITFDEKMLSCALRVSWACPWSGEATKVRDGRVRRQVILKHAGHSIVGIVRCRTGPRRPACRGAGTHIRLACRRGPAEAPGPGADARRPRMGARARSAARIGACSRGACAETAAAQVNPAGS
jgi:hypothetical protein